jgi:DNA mismatch repair ATPase MutS
MASGGGGAEGARLLYDEYAALTQKYKAAYGPDTVVLMEVGSFMEWYDCDRGLGADVPRVCSLLNVQATRKCKAVQQISRTNPAFSGVPRVALSKYVPVLVDAGMTVVLVTQVTPPPNPRRAVTEILSRATLSGSALLDVASAAADASAGAAADAAGSPSSGGGACLMAVYVERGRGWLAAGWAVVDLATGRTSASEVVGEARRDALRPLDALRRAYAASAPSELVLCRAGGGGGGGGGSIGDEPPPPSVDELRAHLGLGVGVAAAERPPELCCGVALQNAVLARAFPSTGFLAPSEYVNLERMPNALAAFVLALQFVDEHGGLFSSQASQMRMRMRLQQPDVSAEDRHMHTSADAFRQLDVSPLLLRLLNRCSTPAGRRAFRARLLNPLRDAAELRARYEAVDAMLRLPPDALLRVRRTLEGVGDVERLFRRACLGRSGNAAAELVALAAAAQAAAAALRLALLPPRAPKAPMCAPGTEEEDVDDASDASDAVLEDDAAEEGEPSDLSGAADAARAADEVAALVLSRIGLESGGCGGCGGGGGGGGGAGCSPLVPGVFAEVDVLVAELAAARAVFFQAAAALNGAIGAENVRVVEGAEADGGAFLTVTARRWAAAVASGAAARAAVAPWFRGQDATLAAAPAASGPPRLQHPALGAAASDRVRRAAARLGAEVAARVRELQAELVAAHSDTVWAVVRAVERLDVAATCARNARDMRHVRPELAVGGAAAGAAGAAAASVDARALRHPIIESLRGPAERREAYVPNDVALGCRCCAPRGAGAGACACKRGLLLYGVNAVGKSSVMKAVGLAVVMAQAGMFVAADALRLAPFASLFTRIGLRDDLAAGHSTFAVEMLELRAILRRAGPGSLVIGDELCAGTEAASALAIVGAGVAQLAERGAAFVLATHLHELVALPQVRDAPGVHAMHLSVRHDAATGRLEMGRTLTPGPGLQTYGLEVCRALDMGEAFLAAADAIRRVVLDEGAGEGAGEGGAGGGPVRRRASRYNARVLVDRCGVCGNAAQETHHIVPQAVADARVKNRAHNLVPLCTPCHDAVHAGRLRIDGFRATSDGVLLSFGLHEGAVVPSPSSAKV